MGKRTEFLSQYKVNDIVAWRDKYNQPRHGAVTKIDDDGLHVSDKVFKPKVIKDHRTAFEVIGHKTDADSFTVGGTVEYNGKRASVLESHEHGVLLQYADPKHGTTAYLPHYTAALTVTKVHGAPKHRAVPDTNQPIRLSANQLWEIGNVLHTLTEHGDNDSFDTDNQHVSFGNIPVNGDDGEPVGEIVMDAETGGWFFEVAR